MCLSHLLTCSPQRHLLCDRHMKDNGQNKVINQNFNIKEREEVMCDAFGKTAS